MLLLWERVKNDSKGSNREIFMLTTRIMKRHQREFEDSELQKLLDEEDTQTQKQLAVSHMKRWKRSRRKGSGCLINYRRETRSSEGQYLKSWRKGFFGSRFFFALRLVTRREIGAFEQSQNLRSHGWVQQATTSTTKCKIYGLRVLLCFWGDHNGTLQHELLKPKEIV